MCATKEDKENFEPKTSRLHPQSACPISTGTDTPSLTGVPIHVKDAELAGYFMPSEHFERNNGSVAEHVTSNTAMEDLERAVIAGVCEEGVAATGMEFDRANSLPVVTQRLVGFGGKIEIVPEQTPVIRTHYDVVSSGCR